MTQLHIQLSVDHNSEAIATKDLQMSPGIYLLSMFTTVTGHAGVGAGSNNDAVIELTGISSDIQGDGGFLLPTSEEEHKTTGSQGFAQIVVVVEPTVVFKFSIPEEYPGYASCSSYIFYEKLTQG